MSGGSQTQTTRTAPWDEQKPYLETGFKRAEDLYSTGKMTPSYYDSTRIAPFDPASQAAQTGTLSYATGLELQTFKQVQKLHSYKDLDTVET